ncbi:MAG: hypothetical protein JWM38_1281 [Sphingomonas bacterium]|jgi:uncharacterized membrane protein|nr:hypothetical protein [Sphingomonas bacterium]MDB5685223.1 hypothetical protein [Sphingomonas bacterium]MDB5717854.1 hypothetical protein [Sphingomonas bacterium]
MAQGTDRARNPGGGMNEALRRNIAAMDEQRDQEKRTRRLSARIADRVTAFAGSMTFVVIHLVAYGLWLTINLGWLPILPRFDPSFVILAMEASVEAIFLSTFVLISQNRMAELADRRADLDLHINLLTEHELTKLTVLVAAIADRLGVESDADGELGDIVKDVEPIKVLDELDRREE